MLAVVESNYLEEERRQRDLAEAERRRANEIEKRRQAIREQKDQQFDIGLSIVSSFTLPFVLISGIFGMNLENLPIDVVGVQ